MSKHAAYKHVVAGTKSEAGFAMVSEEHAKALVADGLIEVNSEIKDASGNIAARAINTAIEVHPEEAAAPAPVKAKQTFEITGGLIPPAIVRPPLPAREEVYPFSKLDVGQSFYLTGEMKKYVSTVTAANRRFKVEQKDEAGNTVTTTNKKGEVVPVLVETRKFVLRGVTAGQTYENGFVEPATGSRIFRVQ